MLALIDMDLADVDTDGIFDGITGAGPWDSDDWKPATQVNGGAPDGLAHQLNLTSGDNLGAITLTVTGTDADGNVITEAITGPAATTVESTKFFKTVTGLAASSTLGANTLDVGWVDEAVSPTIKLDWRRNVPSNYFLNVDGTINVDVDHAVENVEAVTDQHSINWINVSSSLLAETADSAAFVQIAAGYTAFRMNVNSYSSGARARLYVSQPEKP
ncbi:MAG TPA: hypothetical protein VNA66_11445 [Gammaproteobacteria bacterium]|nr:hypothetical protein [Gammaproteobacteria bacterium]